MNAKSWILLAAVVGVGGWAAWSFGCSSENVASAEGERILVALDDMDVRAMEPLVQGSFKAALERVRKSPDDEDLWGEVGAILDVHGFALQAAPCYEHAARLAPKEWQWSYLAGFALRTADRKRALGHFQRAFEAGGQDPALHYNHADTLLALDRHEEASESFAQMAKAYPQLAPAHAGLGSAELAKGNDAKAMSSLKRAVELAPNWQDARRLYAEVLRRTGRLDAAENESERSRRASSIIPLDDVTRSRLMLEFGESLELRRQRSRLAIEQKRPKDAERLWRQLLEHDAESSEGLVGLSIALLAQHRLEDAKVKFEKVLNLDDSVGPAITLGQAALKLRKPEFAIHALLVALEREPERVLTRVNLGTAYAATGDKARGRTEWLEVLESEPTHPDALFNLAQSYAETGKYQESARCYERLGRAHPTLAKLYDPWALVLARIGRTKEAIEELRRAIKAHPGNATIDNRLAWLLAAGPERQHRRPDEAWEIVQRLLSATRGQNPVILDTAAVVAAARRDFPAAMKLERAALQLAGQTPGFRKGLFERMGKRLTEYFSKHRVYAGPP